MARKPKYNPNEKFGGTIFPPEFGSNLLMGLGTEGYHEFTEDGVSVGISDVKNNDGFSDEVAKSIGNYVYRLIDPRNGETFYVGKGQGNRVFSHVNAANVDDISKDKVHAPDNQEEDQEDSKSLKMDRIRAIRNAKLEVIHIIHRHGIPDSAIYEVEAAVIDAFSGLTNIQGGHGSGARGPMSVQEIQNQYDLPPLFEEPNEKLVLININRIEDRSNIDAILKQTQIAWRISKHRADQADYILAVQKGVVIGAFKMSPEKWVDVNHKNFPEQVAPDEDFNGRKGFHGSKAPDHIWEKFVGEHGKRIEVSGMKHIQNPIRYWNIP